MTSDQLLAKPQRARAYWHTALTLTALAAVGYKLLFLFNFSGWINFIRSVARPREPGLW